MNEWQRTKVWPPEGLTDRILYVGNDYSLYTEVPLTVDAYDNYKVNFTASNGEFNRWTTQVGGPVIFQDRK